MVSMRSSLVLIAVLAVVCMAQEQQQRRPHVAVFPFEWRGVTEDEALILTDRLQSELQQLGVFRIIERNQLDAILEEQGLQLDECSSSECVVELGQLVNAEFIVTGSVGKVANVFTVSARLINVETGDIVRTATEDIVGDLGRVLTESMRLIAVSLSPMGAAQRRAKPEPLQAAPSAAGTQSKPESVRPKLYMDGRSVALARTVVDGREVYVTQLQTTEGMTTRSAMMIGLAITVAMTIIQLSG